MDKSTRKRFNPDILAAAGRLYGLETADFQELPGAESFIYAYERQGQGYILRLGHSMRRNEAQIRGEVDWINYLAANGVSVARAVHSLHGNLVEQVSDGHDGYFLTTSFMRAPGGPPHHNGQWNQSLFRQYGQLMGRIHTLSEDYIPHPAGHRGHWDDPTNLEVVRWLPPGDEKIASIFHELVARIQTFPKNRETYGMIHQDAHAGNFFVDDQGQITLFDFDDCVYGWYIYDVAMVLFYAVTNVPEPEKFGQEFLNLFLAGYQREKKLSPEWTSQIPHFLKLREIDLYAQIHRIFDLDHLEDKWVATYMRGRRERILAGTPYLDLNWSQYKTAGSSIPAE